MAALGSEFSLVHRMTIGRRSVDADLPATDTNPVMSSLTRTLDTLTPGASSATLKPPTFDGEAEVEQFVQQFKDLADENPWPKRKSILHLRSSLERPDDQREPMLVGIDREGAQSAADKIRDLGQSNQEVVDVVGNGPSLLPQRLVYNLAIEIRKLLSMAHAYIPVWDRERIAIDYLIRR